MLQAAKNMFRHRLLRAHGVRVTADVPVTTIHGWTLCPDAIRRGDLVYSFGIGKHVKLDVALIERFGVTVHGFDPTPVSITWVREQVLPAQFVFHDFGIAAFDGSMQFYPPRRSGSAHYSPVARFRGAADVDCATGAVHRLDTIARTLGHDRIDILKIDIEGGEYDVIPDVIASQVAVRQLLIEFHHNYETVPFGRTVNAVHDLERAGFSLFHVGERTYEMSFIRRDGPVRTAPGQSGSEA